MFKTMRFGWVLAASALSVSRVFGQTAPVAPAQVPPTTIQVEPIKINVGGQVRATGAFQAKLIEIVDGDTLIVQQGDKKLTVHLIGVVAPDVTTDAGKAAVAFLRERTMNAKFLQVETWSVIENGEQEAIVKTGEDPKGQRPIGRPSNIFDPTGTSADQPRGVVTPPSNTANRVLNLSIIKAGLAKVDRNHEYSGKALKGLEDAEAEARKAKIGLWAEPANH